ncbi:DUF2147 domain-containing protein [Flavobacteriaceae bacterium TP-CH-4]|uniref:DUF2147 domain-containing protein n=1 Tax=Pelagihabitans pacificus TaxID=2696054 RepID=A0A967AZE9_9FLAO|nr:DUF2147 domain-containing protein [Pelagihabitans pacificus]NHF59351.1 DUF2147 domain-containing protein [Pelagihabitans pacificus]
MRTLIKLVLLTIFSISTSYGQGIFGKWKTIDDRTGKPKAVIDIYEKDGLMYGHVLEILEKGKEDSLCTKCDGDRKNKPVVGMTIIEAAEEKSEGVYKGDTLFDPEQAMTFRCKIWLNPDNSDELKVRGYLAFLYRTQTWLRVD